MANFEGLDFQSTGMNSAKKGSGLNEYATSLFDPSLTWKDIDFLKSITKLPVVLKGILTGKNSTDCSAWSNIFTAAEDARLAAQAGVSGIIVSNHGARQLDTVPATVRETIIN
jgi:(S)-2-hydroxy-acid oxidase